jgi:putative transposase
MKGFRSVGGAQRFPAGFSGLSPHCRPHRHLMTATEHRAGTTMRFAIRDRATGVTGLPIAA